MNINKKSGYLKYLMITIPKMKKIKKKMNMNHF